MSVNRISIIGNVGSDPEIRTMPDGVTKVASVRVAVTERGYTTREGQQVPEHTDWFTVVFWRQRADFALQYIHKGDKIYVDGKMKSRQYQDKNGQTQERWSIHEEKVELLTPKAQTTTQAAAPAPMAAPAPPPQFTYPQAQAAAQATRQYMQGARPMQPAQPPMQTQMFQQPAPPPAAPSPVPGEDDLPF